MPYEARRPATFTRLQMADIRKKGLDLLEALFILNCYESQVELVRGKFTAYLH